MSHPDRHAIGVMGERRAALYLLLRGYRILERNYRTGHLELDLIAVRGRTILFAEVKTRSYQPGQISSAPPPGTAVRFEKQRNTRQAATAYLRSHPTHRRPRMDVLEVFLEKREGRRPRIHHIRHIQGAY